MSLRSRYRVKASMVLTRADTFTPNDIRSLLNIVSLLMLLIRITSGGWGSITTRLSDDL